MYIDSGMGHAYLLGPGCDEASAVSGCTSEHGDLMDSLTKPEHRETSESTGKPTHVVAKRPRKTAARGKSRR
jgi:hypothetical protein